MRYAQNRPPRPVTVLVADDDDDLRALVSATLRGDGYAVVEVADGAEALDYLTRALTDPALRPDVVLTDVRMPQLSGLGVLQALKNALVALPIVVMTALRDDSVQTVAKRLGAVGVLHKPFDMDELRAAIVNAECAQSTVRRRGP